MSERRQSEYSDPAEASSPAGVAAIVTAFLERVDGLTNGEAARLIDADNYYVSKLRKGWRPKRLHPTTISRIRKLISDNKRQQWRVAEPTPEPAAPKLAEPARVWIQRFLLKITEAGATDDEVDEARVLLTNSDVVTYAHGGAPAQAQLSEEERLQVVKLIAESAIIPRLKRMGRKVNASFAR